MAHALHNIITSESFTEMFQFLTNTIHRQNANNLLSKDPNGPVNPSLQPDIIHGAAAMKSTTYMALHFHFPCYSHRSQQTHVGLHATRPCRGLYPIWNSSL